MPDQLQNPLLKTEDGTIRAIVRQVCSSLCQLLVDISVANFANHVSEKAVISLQRWSFSYSPDSARLLPPQGVWLLSGPGGEEAGLPWTPPREDGGIAMSFVHAAYPSVSLSLFQAVEGGYEVRGCCFKHTAANEQHMCDVIASALGSEGIVVGNKPLGVWQYSIPEEPVPQVSRLIVSTSINRIL